MNNVSTGNLFIEYETHYIKSMKTVKSGLMSTISDKYILIFGNNGNNRNNSNNGNNDDTLIFYIMDTFALKELITNNKYKNGNCINNNILSKGYLVPIEDIKMISSNYIKHNNEFYKMY